MTAKVERMMQPGLATAWCQECLTGYGGGLIITRNWAYVHNELSHPSEAVPTGAALLFPEGEQ